MSWPCSPPPSFSPRRFSPALRATVRRGSSLWEARGGWDYLTFDGEGRRLFVTRGTRVAVVDLSTGKEAGEISGTEGVHGVALATDLGRGFASNARANTVTIFDLKTLKRIADVKVPGENPDAILYDPATKRVFAFNGRSKNATAIDAATGAVLGTIALGGKPEFSVSGQDGTIYVNIEDTSELLALDAKALTVTKRWPLTPCEEPTGLAIDRKASRLFAGCSNEKLAIVDISSGKVRQTLTIGKGNDAVAYDAGTGFVLCSNGEGTLTVVKEEAPGKYAVLENVATQKSARTLTVDEKTHDVYLAAASFGPAPEATKENPRPRSPMVKDSFVILVFGK